MSRKYQGLIVLNTKSLAGSIDELVSAVSQEIEAEGAKVEKIDNHGRREFAYESNHLEAAHYVSYTFDCSPDRIEKIQDRLRLHANVHMQHYQRVA